MLDTLRLRYLPPFRVIPSLSLYLIWGEVSPPCPPCSSWVGGITSDKLSILKNAA